MRGASDDKFEAQDKFKLPSKRLVSGGNDNTVMLWEFIENKDTPVGTKVGEHTDWVRDVAWSNNIGLLHETIASCSEDGLAKVWRQVHSKEGVSWIPKEVKVADKVPLWKVSWSQVGNMLAVAGGDNNVHIFSEEASGDWKQIQVVNESSASDK